MISFENSYSSAILYQNPQAIMTDFESINPINQQA